MLFPGLQLFFKICWQLLLPCPQPLYGICELYLVANHFWLAAWVVELFCFRFSAVPVTVVDFAACI